MESCGEVITYLNDVLALIYSKMQILSAAVNRHQTMIVSARFYNSLKHILLVNRFTGIFPITVIRHEDAYILKWSWLKVIISSLFFIVFTIVTLTGLILSYSIEEVYNIRLKTLASKMVTLAEIVTLSSTWLVGQICIPILFQKYWAYLVSLKKCDDIIGTIEPTTKIRMVISMVFLFTFTCLGMDIYMWSKLAVPVMGTFSFIWKMVPFYFTYVFTMIIELNFWVSIYGITTRIKRLNKLVSNYVDAAEAKEAKDYNNMIKTLSVIKGETEMSGVKRKSVSPCQFLSPESIKSFIATYRHISDATSDVNSFFGLMITIILFTIIICLVITPYVLYQQILNSKSNSFIFTQTYWMICHVLRLLFIIEPCHMGEREGAEIRKSVVKLLSLNLTDDAQVQARTFWITIMENTIEFSASGLTIINRTVLPTIGGAVFTYLAILFQYNSN